MTDRVLHSRFGLPVLFVLLMLYQALALSAFAPEDASRQATASGTHSTLTPVSRGRSRVLSLPAASVPVAQPTVTPSLLPTATATAAPTSTPTVTDVPTATPTALPTPTEPPTEAPTLAPTAPLTVVAAQAERTARVPILMYHYISDPPAGADRVRVDLSVTPARFEEQLRYLKEAGYSCISLSALVRYLQDGTPLPPKPVVLTFDDGYVDNYLYAFPLLRQYGFTGTFFVITNFLDEQRHGYMNWEQAATMEQNGMDIESHSYTHPDMRGRSVDYLVWQILGSAEAIEAHLHKKVTLFCYPAGRYDAQTIAVLRSAHIVAAVTTVQGADHATAGLMELSRVRVHGGESLDRFKELMGYYR